MLDPPAEFGGELRELCDYTATALDRALPGEVAEKAKHHSIASSPTRRRAPVTMAATVSTGASAAIP